MVSWGESTFIQGGANVINPIDVSKLRVAGAELKEAFLPVNMIWGSFNLTENLSAEALYMFEFEQTEGDFDSFHGFWTIVQQGPDSVLHFECDFDFGIESLEGILDPIAERVIKETVAWAVVGLHGSVKLRGDLELLPATSPASLRTA